jgi:hypothetical protein
MLNKLQYYRYIIILVLLLTCFFNKPEPECRYGYLTENSLKEKYMKFFNRKGAALQPYLSKDTPPVPSPIILNKKLNFPYRKLNEARTTTCCKLYGIKWKKRFYRYWYSLQKEPVKSNKKNRRTELIRKYDTRTDTLDRDKFLGFRIFQKKTYRYRYKKLLLILSFPP